MKTDAGDHDWRKGSGETARLGGADLEVDVGEALEMMLEQALRIVLANFLPGHLLLLLWPPNGCSCRSIDRLKVETIRNQRSEKIRQNAAGKATVIPLWGDRKEGRGFRPHVKLYAENQSIVGCEESGI